MFKIGAWVFNSHPIGFEPKGGSCVICTDLPEVRVCPLGLLCGVFEVGAWVFNSHPIGFEPKGEGLFDL